MYDARFGVVDGFEVCKEKTEQGRRSQSKMSKFPYPADTISQMSSGIHNLCSGQILHLILTKDTEFRTRIEKKHFAKGIHFLHMYTLIDPPGVAPLIHFTPQLDSLP